MSAPMRYFVEVTAPDEHALRRLRDFGFDLFGSTARAAGDRFAIDGLVTLAETARLVEAGYPVLIKSEAPQGGVEVSEFPEWIAARLAERKAAYSWRI